MTFYKFKVKIPYRRNIRLTKYFSSTLFLFLIFLNLLHAKPEVISLQDGTSVIEKPTQLSATVSAPNTSVTLNWTDNANNETNFWIERSINMESGFKRVGTAKKNRETFTDNFVNPNTTYFYRIRAINKSDQSEYSTIVEVTTPSLADGWTNLNIGNPKLPGSGSFSNSTFYVKGNGYMTDNKDNFHYTFKQLTGNGELVGRLINMPKARWDNQTLMLRASLESDSKYFMAGANAKK